MSLAAMRAPELGTDLHALGKMKLRRNQNSHRHCAHPLCFWLSSGPKDPLFEASRMGVVSAPAAVFEAQLGERGFIVGGNLPGPPVKVPHRLSADAAYRLRTSTHLLHLALSPLPPWLKRPTLLARPNSWLWSRALGYISEGYWRYCP